MKLKHTRIPVEFLRVLPEGIKLVTRHGDQYLVVEELYDDQGNSLMSDSVHIHGERALAIHVSIGASEGLIFIDAYWGSHAKLYSFVPDLCGGEQVVRASSPATERSLMETRACDQPDCDCTDAIVLMLPGKQNVIHLCGRLGCPGHHVDIREVPRGVSDRLSDINYFGHGEDELFRGI